jgi:Arc/MetJ-type ribon-helix-helix transcriptional regulator
VGHWRRTRMISFRVTDQEYEDLKTRAESQGARNVSEFARTALCDRKQPTNEDALERLQQELQELKTYVSRIAQARDANTRESEEAVRPPVNGGDPPDS